MRNCVKNIAFATAGQKKSGATITGAPACITPKDL